MDDLKKLTYEELAGRMTVITLGIQAINRCYSEHKDFKRFQEFDRETIDKMAVFYREETERILNEFIRRGKQL